MRPIISILIAVFASTAFAQTQADVDYYARRESELAGSVAAQERANAALRNHLRNQPTQSDELIRVSAESAALRKRVAEVRIRRDVARDQLQATRDRLLERAEAGDEIKQAQKAVTDANAELDKVAAPIIEKLQQSDHYQEAQALADAAAQAGEAMQIFGDDKSVRESDIAFEAAIARVRQMEVAAVDADPRAFELKKAVKAAEDSLAALRVKQDEQIENTGEIVAARNALDAEQKQFDAASAELSDAEKRLSALRQANPAGDATANLLRDGEQKLADLNDQLEQARIARKDTEDRVRQAEQAASANAYAVTTIPYDPDYYYEPTYYSPSYTYVNVGYGRYYGSIRHCYPYYYYPSYCYYPRSYYPYDCYPSYGYGYGYYGYPGYYGYGSYYGGGWSFGIGFSFGYSSFYKPYYCHPYSYGSYGYAYYNRHGHHYDHHDGDGHYRSRNDCRGVERSAGRSGKSEAWQRSHGARDSVAAAQQATADAGRDYRWRTGSSYASAGTGSSRSLNGDDVTRRVRDYEQSVSDRRVALDSQRRANAQESVRRAAPGESSRAVQIGSSRAIQSESSRASRTAETRSPAVISNRAGRDENPIYKELNGRSSDDARSRAEASRSRIEDARARSTPEEANQERLNDSRARAAEAVRASQGESSRGSSRGAQVSRSNDESRAAEPARPAPSESSRARSVESANQQRLNESRARAAQNVPPPSRARESAPPPRSAPPPPSVSRGGGRESSGPPPSASSRGGGGGGSPRSSAGSSSRGGGGSSGGGSSRGGGGGRR